MGRDESGGGGVTLEAAARDGLRPETVCGHIQYAATATDCVRRAKSVRDCGQRAIPVQRAAESALRHWSVRSRARFSRPLIGHWRLGAVISAGGARVAPKWRPVCGA